MPQLEGSLVIIWYLSPLADENTAAAVGRAGNGAQSLPSSELRRLPAPYFPPGAAASPAGHQLWESYLFHACYSKWSWLNSETNVCYSPSSAGEIDKDTQGPKGLIS